MCKILERELGWKIVDPIANEARIKKSKGTEEEPFEG